MLKIKKVMNEYNIYDIKIINDEQEFNIVFGGNGDLYFFTNKINFQDEHQVVNFEITKENYELYSLFDILYHKIINCDIYKIDEYDLDRCTKEELEEKQIWYDEWNQELRDHPPYNLIHDGVISWCHDEQRLEEANVLNIYKEEDRYRLEFILRNTEFSPFIDIRFRNSGSRYEPFNMPFMELYQSLQAYDTEYHQIHIEEYLFQKTYQKR